MDYLDETDDTDTTGFAAGDFASNVRQLNIFYSIGAIYALPVSGDATTLEKAGL